MISIDDQLNCCGINEISYIYNNRNNPKQTIKETCNEIFEHDKTGAFLIFSDIGKKTAAKNLKKYITENKLGRIIQSKAKINPNSKNSLQVWIWEINQQKLKQYYKKINPYYEE